MAAAGFFLGTENSMIYALTLFLLTLPIAIINNKYFRMGFKTLFHGSPNMDSLIALGAGASILYGVYALYKIAFGFGHGDPAMVSQFTHDLYFEGAGTILTLITLGKFFEARAKGRTSDAINKLLNLAPKTATIIRDGVESVVPVEEVEKGDILIVKAGESVPVDGALLEGNASIDESALPARASRWISSRRQGYRGYHQQKRLFQNAGHQSRRRNRFSADYPPGGRRHQFQSPYRQAGG